MEEDLVEQKNQDFSFKSKFFVNRQSCGLLAENAMSSSFWSADQL